MRLVRWFLTTTRGRITGGVAVAVLVPAAAMAWWLGSPLLFDKTVDEEFPRTVNATVPDDMSRADAEAIMEEEAEREVVVTEQMPAVTPEPSPTAEPPGPTPAEGSPDPTPATATPTAEPSPTAEPPGPTPSEGTPDPTPETATPTPEPEAPPPGPVALAAGSFRDADAFHKGEGLATVYELADGSRVLRLEDLRVTNGPALHVFLARHADPMSRNDVTGPGYVDLGDLKGNIGNQNYPIPAGLDLSEFASVVIYCVPFHVVFSVAPLTQSGA